jgi:transposase
MAVFKEYDCRQNLMLPIVLTEQLLPGSFEYTLNELVETEIDLSVFNKLYKNDTTGAPAWNPKIMIKLILYCYSKGIVSSRKMMELARTNIVAKALCADEVPHFTTIAAFIAERAEELKTVFTEILLICGELQLIDRNMFAVDGCKLPSNASKEWSGTYTDLKKKQKKLEALAERIIERHSAHDANCVQIERDELIEEKRQHAERIASKAHKIKTFLATNERRMGSRNKEIKSNVTDNESATMKSHRGVIQGYNGLAVVDEKNQVIVAAEAFGNGQEHDLLEPMLRQTEANLKAVYGSEERLAGKTFLADTGYFNEDNLKIVADMKIDAVIPDQNFRQRDSRFDDRDRYKKTTRKFGKQDFTYRMADDCYICPNGKTLLYKSTDTINGKKTKRYRSRAVDCNECPFRTSCLHTKHPKSGLRTLFVRLFEDGVDLVSEMMAKVDRPEIRELYSHRMGIVEPVFGNITYCKGLDRFTLRTKIKVNAQWLLFCMVHNIEKLSHIMA